MARLAWLSFIPLANLRHRWDDWQLARRTHAPGERHARGRWGEAQALRWLRREHKFRLLARNWREGRGELDLIGTIPVLEGSGRLLLFVEVRTHGEGALYLGPHSLTARKREVMRQTAHAFRWQHGRAFAHWRHDLVQVTVEADGRPSFILFPDCW